MESDIESMKTKRNSRVWLALSLFFAALAFAGVASAAQAPLRVLLVTGDDVQPAHNWQEVSQAIRETLLASGKFEVRVCEEAAVLESAALNRYDLIFLHLYNAKTPTLSAAAKENLAKFVSGGKGLVVSHLSSASFKEWAEFPEALRTSLGHGEVGPRPAQCLQDPHHEAGPPHYQRTG